MAEGDTTIRTPSNHPLCLHHNRRTWKKAIKILKYKQLFIQKSQKEKV